MKKFLKPFLCALTVFLLLQLNVPAADTTPVIDLTPVPNTFYINQIFNLQVRIYMPNPLPENPAKRKNKYFPTAITISALDKNEEEISTQEIKCELSFYNDVSEKIVVSLDPQMSDKASTVKISAKTGKRIAEEIIFIKKDSEAAEGIIARGKFLYSADGHRVILAMDKKGETFYRRWAVPKLLIKYLGMNHSASVKILSPSGSAFTKQSRIVADKIKLFNNRQAKIILNKPIELNTYPVLNMYTSFANLNKGDENQILIMPGTADIIFGTDIDIYKHIMGALITLSENRYQSREMEIVLCIPLLPQGLQRTGKVYIKELLKIAEERHLKVVDLKNTPNLKNPFGKGDELLYMKPDEFKKCATYISKKTDISLRKKFIIIATASIVIFILGFILLQIITRRRLKRLIKISTTPPR